MSALGKGDLDRFFEHLARKIPCAVKIVLTGGCEALLLGGIRPTGDIDFGIELSPRNARHWPAVERAVAEASRETGIAVQYSDDIDRWSMVSVPAWRQRTRPHGRRGRLSIHLLEPACWAVYKLARYIDSDVDDLKVVLRAESASASSLARLCGLALRSSPKSPALHSFRRRVEHFFREHGPAVWGESFDSKSAIASFHRAARIDGV